MDNNARYQHKRNRHRSMYWSLCSRPQYPGRSSHHCRIAPGCLRSTPLRRSCTRLHNIARQGTELGGKISLLRYNVEVRGVVSFELLQYPGSHSSSSRENRDKERRDSSNVKDSLVFAALPAGRGAAFECIACLPIAASLKWLSKPSPDPKRRPSTAKSSGTFANIGAKEGYQQNI